MPKFVQHMNMTQYTIVHSPSKVHIVHNKKKTEKWFRNQKDFLFCSQISFTVYKPILFQYNALFRFDFGLFFGNSVLFFINSFEKVENFDHKSNGSKAQHTNGTIELESNFCWIFFLFLIQTQVKRERISSSFPFGSFWVNIESQ